MVIPKIGSQRAGVFLQQHATAHFLFFSIDGTRVLSLHSQISQLLLSLTLASFGNTSQLVLMLMLELATLFPPSHHQRP